MNYEYFIELIYNIVMLLLLSTSLLNYFYRDNKKSLYMFLGSLLIVFSEVISVAYLYISSHYSLNLIVVTLALLAFYFFYQQSKLSNDKSMMVDWLSCVFIFRLIKVFEVWFCLNLKFNNIFDEVFVFTDVIIYFCSPYLTVLPMENKIKIGYPTMIFLALILLLSLNIIAIYSENPLLLNASKVIFIPFILMIFFVKHRTLSLIFISFLMFSFFGDSCSWFLPNESVANGSNIMYLLSYFALIAMVVPYFKPTNIDKIIGIYLLVILLINAYFLFTICDISLMTTSPGFSYYIILLEMSHQKFFPKSTKELFDF